MGASGPHPIHYSLGPPKFATQTTLIGSAVFAGLTTVTDRPTDRPRYSVGNNGPQHTTYVVLRCGDWLAWSHSRRRHHGGGGVWLLWSTANTGLAV